MPRALWRRRHTADSPRPAGRRWAGRLRRSGTIARQVLLVGRRARRHTPAGASIIVADSHADPVFGRGLDDLDRTRFRGLSRAASLPLSPAAGIRAARPPAGALSIPLLPGDRTLARRLRFALVNACTLASLVLALSAILLVIAGQDARWGALCVLAGVAFDGVDGALARRLGVASPFGAQMDSLVDMCSFGIATPVVIYAWLNGSAPAWLVLPACALVAACAAIRLARFNVSPKDGRFFCGVPTTIAAAVLCLGTLIAPAELAPGAWVAAAAGVPVIALAMVSGFPYAKLARVLRLPPWVLVLPIGGALISYRLTFVGVVVVYLLSGPLLWLLRRPVDEAV